MVRDKEKSVCAIGYRFDHRFRPDIYMKVRGTRTSSLLCHVKFLAESIFKFCIKYKRKYYLGITYIYIHIILENNRVTRHGGNRIVSIILKKFFHFLLLRYFILRSLFASETLFRTTRSNYYGRFA